MKSYLVTIDHPYIMTSELALLFGEAELISTVLNVYLVKTNHTEEEIENIKKIKYIVDIREEAQVKLV